MFGGYWPICCCNGWKLVTAESCTGGLIAATCTDLAGSSEWFERGFVTYSNAPRLNCWAWMRLIAGHGAVSEPWCAPWRKAPWHIPTPRSPWP